MTMNSKHSGRPQTRTKMLPVGPFYRLLLLTAQRREEVAAMRGMKWTYKAEWTIPGKRTKNGKAHIVHLSPLRCCSSRVSR